MPNDPTLPLRLLREPERVIRWGTLVRPVRDFPEHDMTSGESGVVVDFARRKVIVRWMCSGEIEHDLSDLAIDLSDPTGRAHVAWAVMQRKASTSTPDDVVDVVLRAAHGEDMAPGQIEALRLVALHVLGVKDAAALDAVAGEVAP